MINVLIADDHSFLRKGIIQILEKNCDARVAGEFSTGEELLKHAEDEKHDLIILDISLPDMNGLDVLKKLIAKDEKRRVLILSMHPEELYAKRAMKNGAAGYMTKDAPAEELVYAVKKILRGERYVSQSLADLLVNDLSRNSNEKPHELLSDREFQVMRFLAEGETIGEIAVQLDLSPKTISTYRLRILQKLDLKSIVQIGNYATKHKLV